MFFFFLTIHLRSPTSISPPLPCFSLPTFHSGSRSPPFLSPRSPTISRLSASTQNSKRERTEEGETKKAMSDNNQPPAALTTTVAAAEAQLGSAAAPAPAPAGEDARTTVTTTTTMTTTTKTETAEEAPAPAAPAAAGAAGLAAALSAVAALAALVKSERRCVDKHRRRVRRDGPDPQRQGRGADCSSGE